MRRIRKNTQGEKQQQDHLLVNADQGASLGAFRSSWALRRDLRQCVWRGPSRGRWLSAALNSCTPVWGLRSW